MPGDKKNDPALGTGLRRTYSNGAWRVGPAYDESGKTDNTEDLFLSKKYRLDQGVAAGKAVSENMVGYSRRGMRQHVGEIKSQTNIWQQAAVGIPILAGFGAGVRNIWRNRASLPTINSIISPIKDVSRPPTFLQKFAEPFQFPFAQTTVTNTHLLDQIDKLVASKDPVKVNLIQEAWQSAIKSADPGMVLRRPTLDAGNPLATIKYFAQSNTSLQANKAVSLFLRNVGSYRKHAEAMGGEFNPGMFTRLGRPNFIQKALSIDDITDPSVRKTLTEIQASIGKIPGASMNMRMASRPGLAGSQLMVSFSGGKFGAGSTLEVPMELADQAGVIVHGSANQSKYIVGKYAEVGPDLRIQSTLKHEEWVLRRFKDEILPKIQTEERVTSRGVRKLINDFNVNTIQGAEWVYNVSSQDMPSYARKLHLAAHKVHLINPIGTGGRLDPEYIGGALKANAGILFPSTSPNQLAESIVSTFNAQSLWFNGMDFPWERRPMQGPGRAIELSNTASHFRRANPLRARYTWMRTPELQALGDIDLMERTAFISSQKYPHVAEKFFGGVPGGAGVADMSVMREFEHVVPLQENLSANYPISTRLLEKLKQGQTAPNVYQLGTPIELTPGELLGHTAEGAPIHFDPSMEITGGYDFTDKTGSFLKLSGRTLVKPGTTEKVFGTDKANLSFLRENIGEQISAHTGIADNSFSDVNVAVSMDALRKNRTVHNMQMLSALQEYTQFVMNDRGQRFKSWEWMQQKLPSLTANMGNRKEFISDIYQTALEQGLPARSIGRIFGALPETDPAIYEELKYAFSPEEVKHIEERIVTGVGQFYYGGPNLGLAGRDLGRPPRGSVEPRLFELLSAGQYGSVGNLIKSDIASRMVMTNPELVREQSVLAGALSSIVHGTKAMHGISAYKASQLDSATIDKILTEGGIVDLERTVDKAGSIYVPGSATSAAMRTYTTSGGLEVGSELTHAYESFLETTYGVAHGAAEYTRSDANRELENLVGRLGEAHVGTITGKGQGLARRELMGSRYLRIKAGDVSTTGDLYTFGLNPRTAAEMLDEMEQIHGKGSMQEARRRMFGTGTAGGMTVRDPDIGLYTPRISRFKVIDTLEPNEILIPQKTITLTSPLGKLEQVALGAMPGMAGDYDDDHAHAMMMSSTIEKDLNGHYSAGAHKELLELDQLYSIRQQLLKARQPSEAILSPEEKMAAAAEKLALAKTKVGPLSVPLSQLRAAVFGSELEFKDKFNAASLLEALEQIPIAGKWVADDRIGDLKTHLDTLAKGAYQGKGNVLANLISEILPADTTAGQLLTQDLTFQDPTGQPITIPKIDIDKVAENLTVAARNLEGQMGEGLSAATLRKLMFGRKSITSANINEYLRYSGGLLSDFKVPMKEAGVFAEAMKIQSAVGNRIVAAGGEMISHMAKPLAIGFGAALGISALLSQPIRSTSPDSSSPPVMASRMKSPPFTSPENIHPDSHITGQPTTSQGTAPHARLALEQQSPRNVQVRVRGVNRSGANNTSVAQRINQVTGGSTRTNLNIRDRRTSLNQNEIDAIMRR